MPHGESIPCPTRRPISGQLSAEVTCPEGSNLPLHPIIGNFDIILYLFRLWQVSVPSKSTFFVGTSAELSQLMLMFLPKRCFSALIRVPNTSFRVFSGANLPISRLHQTERAGRPHKKCGPPCPAAQDQSLVLISAAFSYTQCRCSSGVSRCVVQSAPMMTPVVPASATICST